MQPFLTQTLGESQKLYESGAGYYPDSTVAPLSGTTQQALDMTTARAGGSPLQSAAQGNATSTLNGNFLNSNPHLQGAIDSATQGLVRNYTNAVMPGIEANFSKAGRFGSPGAMGGAVSDAQNNLASQIGNVSSSMSYQNYGDERSRQMQASALSPQLANMDWTNINALSGAGATYDQQAQSQLSDLVARYNYENGGSLDDFIARVNGTGANNYKSATEANYVKNNPLTGALGGALSGAATGASIGGPWGALIGGGIGGLGGYFG